MPELEPIFFLSAFFAGTLMFLAPCTLPLLPAYLGFISGVSEKEIHDSHTKKVARKKIFVSSIFFALGFSIVLIFSGLTAGFLGSLIPLTIKEFFTTAGGFLIVLFGLFMMGFFNISFLNREHRVQAPTWLKIGTSSNSFLLGSAFALGWTPCLGPVYGTILIYASSMQTAFTGFILLSIFALGFSVPLVSMALLIGHTAMFIERISPYMRIISFAGGIVLVLVGIKLIAGNTPLTNWFFELFNYFSIENYISPYL